MRKPALRRSVWGPIVIAAAIAETAAFGVSYFYYRRLNHSQEYRYWMYQNFKPGLELYYKTGEILGDSKVRTYDYSTWGVNE
ncbi:uncharacterized protein LOC121834271 [Ixodes scapularis]|uniref:Putative conserved secreted protein n=1 Tax=Ixodes scapularis TaxID=6945 RepID=A0A4D5RCM4_IXOSC|nr:uncharacterized protein LOC115311151 [Ixodes scapularis]XP_042143954.1 uncharacterized protein LOC121834268 [Ixodes scapularis]XP_042143955.1 uncharacterized protein LOC121834268 [Ixodes scapularis]XP_042143960.1 uncharacterized protein LOC121834271 [Ixodes scapularis]